MLVSVHMAYAILDDLDDETRKRLLPETNKVSLRWIHVADGIDEYVTATRRTLGWQSHFKLQTLVDGKWHDIKIEHNPDEVIARHIDLDDDEICDLLDDIKIEHNNVEGG